jgi:hypothetical protein
MGLILSAVGTSFPNLYASMIVARQVTYIHITIYLIHHITYFVTIFNNIGIIIIIYHRSYCY